MDTFGGVKSGPESVSRNSHQTGVRFLSKRRAMDAYVGIGEGVLLLSGVGTLANPDKHLFLDVHNEHVLSRWNKNNSGN